MYRNQILHYDFLFVHKSEKFQYILVLKEDLTNYTRLYNCASADHYVVSDAIFDWDSLFGFTEMYVSDQGSHFRKEVLKELERLTGCKHHHTTTYAPWANGTVEVVNSTILRVIRSLLSELKLTWKDWSNLTPLIQGVLNHTPGDLWDKRLLSSYFADFLVKTPLFFFILLMV